MQEIFLRLIDMPGMWFVLTCLIVAPGVCGIIRHAMRNGHKEYMERQKRGQ
jgi:hypothetical protein